MTLIKSEGEIKRRYVSIGRIANLLSVNTSSIRFWEQEFKLEIHKGSSGNRQFNRKEVMDIVMIYYLLKIIEFTIRGARSQFQKYKDGKLLPDETVIKKVDEIMN